MDLAAYCLPGPTEGMRPTPERRIPHRRGCEPVTRLVFPGRARLRPSSSAVRRPGLLVIGVAALAGCLTATAPASGNPLEQELTLAECILLAVQNNRDLAGNRLGRLIDRLSLEDAEDTFRPRSSLGLSATGDSRTSASGRDEVSTLGIAPTVTMRIPTGGQVSLRAGSTVTDRDSASQSVTVEFRQPLLRGGGTTIGTAGVVTARRAEQGSVLAFEAAVERLVARTVRAYRSLVQAMRAEEIAERSLQRARELLAVNRVLIETGRMAQEDIVQTEASIAERELSLTEAEGALNDARLALIDILDIDSRTLVLPVEYLRVEPAEFDRDRSLERALRNRPDYLRALLDVEQAELALALAEDARRWDLDLTASAAFGHDGRTLSEAYSRFDDDFRVGFTLDIPIGVTADSARRAYEKAQISLRRLRLRIAEMRQSIEIEVHGAVRRVEVQLRRAELARQARELAERKLETERIKLNAGLSSNFRLVRFEDDLVRSQNSEVDATIAYLNALTTLDQALGTTLDTWHIDIRLQADKRVEE